MQVHWGRMPTSSFTRSFKKVRNELNASEEAESSWSSRGFSNFYYQRISVANLKGLGHFFLVAEALLRNRGTFRFVELPAVISHSITHAAKLHMLW